jgi:Tfp pilus assembly protein PilE
MIDTLNRLRASIRPDDGFTMVIALGVMLVTGLLLVVAYTAATGDVTLSRNEIIQKQAYYAALAGVQEYEYQLQNNPDYWETCKTPTNIVPQEEKEKEYNGHYTIKLLPASTAPEGTKECLTTNPFGSMIQSGGSLANTFRIESTGYAGMDKRTVIATFNVVGFLNYVYFTQYEVEDPSLNGGSTKECEQYYAERVKSGAKCQTILFGKEDSVNGPMHTDDAANVECSKELTFGRKGHTDVVEINGGTWPKCSPSSEPTYNDAKKEPTKGEELKAPQSDTSLRSYVESENEFTGVTYLELNGSTKEIGVTYYNKEKKKLEKAKSIKWPKNGLIYVQAGPEGCGYTYNPEESDESNETSRENECGNVYVKGTYSEPLTVAAENSLIINGNIEPTKFAKGKLGEAPEGTTTLGLIATEYVRVYHPIKEEGRKCSNVTPGSLSNPWIYAAILSTSHSFIVDNFGCGENLGDLNVYGAIAQKFRGPVGTTSGSGYIKNYVYDERLATDEPPFFLSPLNAGWEVERETAPAAG